MAQSSPYTAHPPEWPRVAQRSLYTSTFTRVLSSTSSTAYPPQVDLAGMWGCQALKYRSSETSQVSIRCVVLFSIKNPFRAEPLFSCEDQFFEGGEFRSKVIFFGIFALVFSRVTSQQESQCHAVLKRFLEEVFFV